MPTNNYGGFVNTPNPLANTSPPLQPEPEPLAPPVGPDKTVGPPQPEDWNTSAGYMQALNQFGTAQQWYTEMRNEVGQIHGPDHSQRTAVFDRYRPQLQELNTQLSPFGVTAEFDDNGVMWFGLPDASGGTLRTDDWAHVQRYLQSQAELAATHEARQVQWDDFIGQFQEWMTDFESGASIIDPFEDDRGWMDMVQSVTGDMQGMPDMQELLLSLNEFMPMWQYTADELPDMSAPERMAKFFEDLAARGFTVGQSGRGLDQQLRDFLYRQAQELSPRNMMNQIGIDKSRWDQMTNAQIAEIMKAVGRKSVFDDKEIKQYVDAKMRIAKRVNMEQYNSVIAGLAAKGVGHGGAVVRSAQELAERLTEAEMGITADVMMKGIELAEQGKWQAMAQWGQISDTEAALITEIGGLKSSVFKTYFDYLTDIGSISASEYSTRSQEFIQAANLELKYDLGVAELDVEKYISDRGLDLEGLQLEYDNYWRNRGANLDEKQAEFDAAIQKWQTSAMMTEMIDGGRQDRLVQMASLALKAFGGDADAKFQWQNLALQEMLQQRGMDLDQAFALADLMQQDYQFGENVDLQKWVEKHRAILQKELTRLGIEGELQLMERQAELEDDGFWGGVMDFAGGVVDIGGYIFDREPERRGGGGTGGTGETGDAGGQGGWE